MSYTDAWSSLVSGRRGLGISGKGGGGGAELGIGLGFQGLRVFAIAHTCLTLMHARLSLTSSRVGSGGGWVGMH